MSKFVINLEDETPPPASLPPNAAPPRNVLPNQPQPPAPQARVVNRALPFENENAAPRRRKSLGWRVFQIVAALFIVGALLVGVGGYFYYQNKLKSPAYSLALLIESARGGNQKETEKYLDADAVVENFVPQITAKATERYGRNVPPKVLARINPLIEKFKPTIKNYAKNEVPRIIKEKTASAPNVSPFAMSVGIERALTISEKGDTAELNGSYFGRDIAFTMKRDGERWKVVGIRDDVLADQIAEKIGQQVIQASTGGIQGVERKLGVEGLQDLMKQVEGLLK